MSMSDDLDRNSAMFSMMGVWVLLIAVRVGVLIWASTLLLRSDWATRDDPAWCSPSLAVSMATLVIVHWVATTVAFAAQGIILGRGLLESARQAQERVRRAHPEPPPPVPELPEPQPAPDAATVPTPAVEEDPMSVVVVAHDVSAAQSAGAMPEGQTAKSNDRGRQM
jgi:hypothetical protein